ncbi:MAG TPA: hypothetical protein VF487_18350 [Chitinophagaceae bacterium]
MKCFTLTILGVFIGLVSFSQISIKLEDVSKHTGDSVKVCGKVYGIRYLADTKNSPTFINMGAAFPNQQLTVVIWGDVRGQFETAPEELFKDKEICVTGRIQLYKEKVQIVVTKKEKISL